MHFQYQPLPQGSKAIRVLELHPGRRKDGIECSLEHCSFPPTETAVYEPLSYCWGDQLDTVPIVVNRCTVDVTRNLHAALVRLRLENEKRRIWVDAICINQNDDIEKSDQVQMMREIYQHGSRTLVWLGPDSLVLTKGFSVITKILKGHETSQRLDKMPSVHTYNRTPLLAVFELPYFTRIWVIQEVAVSSSVEVFCGHNSISLDSLIMAEKWSDATGTEEFDEMRSLSLFRSMVAARSRFLASEERDLLRLLITHRSTAATCTKDKIYALLGLLGHGDLQSGCIVPNYRKEYAAEEAYVDTAVSIITTSGNLDLLSVSDNLSFGSSSLQLPTWVPDWSRPSTCDAFIQFSEDASFAATGSSTSHPIFRDDQKAIGLLGHVFDKVDCTGYACADKPAPSTRKVGANIYRHQFSSNIQALHFNAKNLRAWKSWLRIVSALSRGSYVTDEPMFEVYLKTVVSGCDIENTDKLAEDLKAWEYYVGRSSGPSGLFDHSGFWIAYSLLSVGFKRLKDTVFRTSSLYFSSDPFLRTYGRSMFTTKGTYIGLGPKDMQTGDLLALLEGGKVPYILRRNGETFTFVGECYVHGAMRGERFNATRCKRIWLT